MKLSVRKKLRLENYDYSASGAYFITICVKDRKRIFGDIVGADALIRPKTELSNYGKTAEKYLRNIPDIDKYVIMPDHIHLIIKIPFANGTMKASSPTSIISARIRSFKILVSKEIGFSVFQRSYFDHVIRNETDYKEICQYIENNPAGWIEKSIKKRL